MAICHECGVKVGNPVEGHVATFNHGVCDWCHKEAAVTQERDYRVPASMYANRPATQE